MNSDNNMLPRSNVPPPLPRSVIEKNKPEEKVDSKERENRGPPAIRPARPKSPRDTTQIVVNGKPVDREQIMPISLPQEEAEEIEHVQSDEDVPQEILQIKDNSDDNNINTMKEAINNLYNNSDIKYVQKEIILPKQQEVIPRQQEIIPRQQEIIPRQQEVLPRQQEVISRQQEVISKQQEIIPRQQKKEEIIYYKSEDEEETDIHSTDATTPVDIIKPTSILSPDPGSLPEIPRKNTTQQKTTFIPPQKQSIPATVKQTATPTSNTNGPKKIIRTIIKRAPPSPRTADQLKKLGYITNYTRLKDSWPEYKFPEIPDDASTDYIIRAYEHCISKIQVDMNVNQYKAGLIILFLVIEVISVKYLGLDGGGYTASQIKAMSRYERLLIEMGEKRMIVVGNNWPVEARITFIAIVNFGIFVLMKFLSGMLGPDLAGMLAPLLTNLFSGHNPTTAVKENQQEINVPEVPERNTNLSGLVGTFAQMASNALGGVNNGAANTSSTPQNFRRPTYRQ